MILKEQYKFSQEERSTLETKLKEMTSLKNSFEMLYQELKHERDIIFEKVMSEKNKLIDELREELKAVNEQALSEVKKVSCNGHDALMLEKVNLINAQEMIIRLTEKVTQLTTALTNSRMEIQRMLKK